MRLADGRHRCPRCDGVFAAEQMTRDFGCCAPCAREKCRAQRARKLGIDPSELRPQRREAPQGFAVAAGKVPDTVLAARYAVTVETVARWRRRLGIPTAKASMPADFAVAAVGMTRLQIAAHWGVHVGTADRWLLRAGLTAERTRNPVPADWAEQCATHNAYVLSKHYRVRYSVLRRWQRLTGVAPSQARSNAGRDKIKAMTRRSARPAPTRTPDTAAVVQHFARIAVAAPAAPVHTDGCPDCTRDRLCRTHQTAQLGADVEAWLAAGNAPREVPVGASGLQFAWTRPAA